MIRRLLAAIARLFSEPSSRTPPPVHVPGDPYRWSVEPPAPQSMPLIELTISRAPDEWSGLFWHVEQPIMARLTCGSCECVGRLDALPPVEDWAYAVLEAWADECEELQGITFWLDVDVIEVENMDTGEVQLLDLARVESAIDDLRSWPGTVTFRTHAPECLPPMPVVFQFRS